MVASAIVPQKSRQPMSARREPGGEDEAVGPGEVVHEAGAVLHPLQREAGELEAGDPPLGAGGERHVRVHAAPRVPGAVAVREYAMSTSVRSDSQMPW